jgi:predicted nucleic acid-binding protein
VSTNDDQGHQGLSRALIHFWDSNGRPHPARTLVGSLLANIFWDTNLFIYLLEDSPDFGAAVHDLRRRMLRRNDRLFTSALTLGEILVKPITSGNRALADRYRGFFRTPQLTVSPFDLDASEAYAGVRQDRSIHPADAIQLACAAAAEVDLFITNDGRLSKKNVPGIKFITGLNEAPI